MGTIHYQPGDAAALRSIGRWCRRWLGLAGCPDDADCCASQSKSIHDTSADRASAPPLNRAGRWPDASSLLAGRILAGGTDAAERRRLDSEDA